MPAKLKFKVIAHVTRELVKLVDDQPLFVKFDGPMKQSDPITKKDGTVVASDMAPPVIAPVTELENGIVGEIICPTVLEEELNKQYPDQKYVGKCFRLIKHRLQGKKYSTFEILEIEIEADEEQKAEPVKTAETAKAAAPAQTAEPAKTEAAKPAINQTFADSVKK